MKREKSHFFLYIIIILHCFLFLFLFFFVKKEYHSDEMWTWGIANSKESPYLFMDKNKNSINFDKWISAEIFINYLTVNNDERFDFSIPYNNSLEDMPPLVPCMLHFISSFFPNRFSFAYIIPIILFAIIGSDYFLYNIAVNGGMSKGAAYITLILFSFSVGGIDIFIYLRHYSFFVMECLMLFHIHMLMYKNGEISNKNKIWIIICNIMGVMTHHYYWIFAFVLGCLYSLYYIVKKKYRLLLEYAVVMLLGVGVGFLLYPKLFESFAKWDESVFGKGYPFGIQVLFAIRIMLIQLIGIAPNNRLMFYLECIGLVLVYSLIVMIPLLIYLSIKGSLKPLLQKIKNIFKKIFSRFIQSIGCCKLLVCVCALEVIVAIVVISKTINMYSMSISANRYLFFVYAPMAIIIVILLRAIIFSLTGNVKVDYFVAIIVLFGMTFAYIDSWSVYIGKDAKEGVTGNDIHDSNIIIVLDKEWYLESLSNIISPDNNIIVLNYINIDKYLNEINKADRKRDTYIISNIKYDEIDEKKDIIDITYNDYENEKYDKEIIEENNKVVDKWIYDKFSKLDFVKNVNYIGKEDTINFGYRMYRIN